MLHRRAALLVRDTRGRAVLAATAGGDRESAGDTDTTAVARCVDVVERRDGEWRLARRTVVHERTGMDDVAPGAPAPGADGVLHRGDPGDQVFLERTAVGLG